MKSEPKKRRKVKVWIVLLVIIGVLIAGMGVAVAASAPGREELKNMKIGAVDFKKLADGVYTGAYHGSKDHMRDTEVKVTVDSGAVKDIEVTGGALAGDNQTKEMRDGLTIKDLLGRVIQKQSLQVDVISGATLTSNAHLKAVENALELAEGK